jgi:hypothetical protein
MLPPAACRLRPLSWYVRPHSQTHLHLHRPKKPPPCMSIGPLLLLNRGKAHYKPTKRSFVAGWPVQVGPRTQLASKKSKWNAISRPRFHGLIAALAGLERRSSPGAIRNHYRRRRKDAVSFYARVFGPVPASLRAHHLNSGPSFYRTAEYRDWSASAYQPARPQSLLEPTPGQTNAA